MNTLAARVLSTALSALVRVRKRRDYRDVHRAADASVSTMKQAVARAFTQGREALNINALRVAIERREEKEIYVLVNAALVARGNGLQPDLEDILRTIVAASGKATASTVRGTLLRASATKAEIKGFAFDVTDPNAVSWIQDHGAELIGDISETDREAIRELVERAFEEQFDVDDLTDEIAAILGGDEERAELIARTETMKAANEGQLQAWDQATDVGLLTGAEEKEWIVTPDDRLCPICEPLDGVKVPLSGTFETELGRVDGPPAHPRCRCAMGLST